MTAAVVSGTLRVPARIGCDVFSPTVQLAYEPNDPYAVYLLFLEEDGPEWEFARDLLAAGIDRPAGFTMPGDVRIWPGPEVVYLDLSSEDGAMVVHLPKAPVLSFLLATFRVVPAGEESRHVDVDRELAELLRGSA